MMRKKMRERETGKEGTHNRKKAKGERRRKADKESEKKEREKKRRKERDETREPKTGGLHTRAQRGRACTRELNFNFHSVKLTLKILARELFRFRTIADVS